MSSKATVLVHVGMMKCASTTLQKNVFAHHSGVHNLWKPDRPELLRELINVDDTSVRFGEIDKLIADARKNVSGKVVVLSNEQMSGLPTLWPAAHRVKKVIPDAKILICIREQKSLFESLYLFQHRTLGNMPGLPKRYSDLEVKFEEFFDFHLPIGAGLQHVTQKYFQLGWRMQYFNTLNFYRWMFGDDNVLMLPMELLRFDINQFARKLENFSGIDSEETIALLSTQNEKNVGLAKDEVVYDHWRRKVPIKIPISKLPFGKKARNLIKNLVNKVGKKPIEWNEEMLERIYVSYKHQNRLLAEDTGLPLVELGYEI